MSATTTHIVVRVPLKIRRRPGRKTVVTPVSALGGNTALPTRADPALLKAVARAFRYQKLLDEGRYGSVSEMAEAERIDRGYLGRLLQLTLLAPDIVEAILDGTPGDLLELQRVMGILSPEWERQYAEIGLRHPRGSGSPAR